MNLQITVFLLISLFLFSVDGFSIRSIKSTIRNAKAVTTMAMTEEPPLTIPNNYNLAIGSVATSAALILGFNNLYAGIPFALLGVLFFVQTGKVRFVFDGEAMELFIAKKDENGETLNASRENIVVGGQNRWKYSTWTNWFMIPSKDFPILMYFKENQTSPEGQVHFFPMFCNGKVMYETLMEKVGSKSLEK